MRISVYNGNKMVSRVIFDVSRIILVAAVRDQLADWSGPQGPASVGQAGGSAFGSTMVGPSWRTSARASISRSPLPVRLITG